MEILIGVQIVLLFVNCGFAIICDGKAVARLNAFAFGFGLISVLHNILNLVQR